MHVLLMMNVEAVSIVKSSYKYHDRPQESKSIHWVQQKINFDGCFIYTYQEIIVKKLNLQFQALHSTSATSSEEK